MRLKATIHQSLPSDLHSGRDRVGDRRIHPSVRVVLVGEGGGGQVPPRALEVGIGGHKPGVVAGARGVAAQVEFQSNI